MNSSKRSTISPCGRRTARDRKATPEIGRRCLTTRLSSSSTADRFQAASSLDGEASSELFPTAQDDCPGSAVDTRDRNRSGTPPTGNAPSRRSASMFSSPSNHRWTPPTIRNRHADSLPIRRIGGSYRATGLVALSALPLQNTWRRRSAEEVAGRSEGAKAATDAA